MAEDYLCIVVVARANQLAEELLEGHNMRSIKLARGPVDDTAPMKTFSWTGFEEDEVGTTCVHDVMPGWLQALTPSQEPCVVSGPYATPQARYQTRSAPAQRTGRSGLRFGPCS
jgi:hypothetical protein